MRRTWVPGPPDARGVPLRGPAVQAAFADGMARLDDTEVALDMIEESISQIERPGRKQRCQYPGILRIEGWLLARRGDLERTDITSLDWVRHQQAKSWELRTVRDLAPQAATGFTALRHNASPG